MNLLQTITGRGWLAVIMAATLAFTAAVSHAGDRSGPKLEMLDKSDYRPLDPLNRGMNYKLTSGNLHKRSIWGWRLELPDGSGLGFGGLAIWTMQEMNGQLVRSDDAAIRTQVRRDGQWVFIHEQLRKNNPLQPHYDRLVELRYPLKMITGLARHIYFEGRDESTEKAFIEKQIAPKAADLAGKLTEARAALTKAVGDDRYVAGQIVIALARLDKVLPAVRGLGARAGHENLLALRLARVSLEQAAEALDAEPPARVLSMPAYDARTGLFVVFGGEHFDYLTNDLWVFDPKARRWQQRHPKTAPEPRADHALTSDGQGKIVMRGGYIYARRNPLPPGWDRNASYYVHAGPGDWAYDLAGDTWAGPADAAAGPHAPNMCPPDTRSYRAGNYLPEHFTAGDRPAAETHEKALNALPDNTWVDLKPLPKFAGNRDWGTLGYDAERDMIYFYNGGHSAYGGTDVGHYHLASNRWDQPVEVELPLNFIGASGKSLPGWSFNRRPWVSNHLWNSYRYHPGLRRLVVAGRFTSSVFPRDMGQPDQNTYLYDPDLADWEKRVPNSVAMSCMGAQVLWAPNLGMIEWGRWLLDDATLDWKKLDPKGRLPNSGIDFCGLVHDPKRSRVLFFSGGTYQGAPYSGEVFAMAVPSLEVTSFTPDGSEHIKALYAGRENSLGTWILREVVYHPPTDMFIFSSNLPGGYSAALDVKGNRWVGLKLPGPHPFGLSSAMAYDAKRDLIYSVGTRADVSAVRLEPRTLVAKPLAEIVAESQKPGK